MTHSTPGLFVDDTNITVAGRDISIIENLMNDDLKNIGDWLTTNKLSLNLTKTEFMLIGSIKRIREIDHDPSIRINGVERVSHSKLVGVTIDESLTWAEHAAQIIKKVHAGLRALRRVRDFVDTRSLTMICKALVEPHFTYCSPVWDSLGASLSQKLQKLQNRAAHIITRSDYNVRSATLLNQLNW